MGDDPATKNGILKWHTYCSVAFVALTFVLVPGLTVGTLGSFSLNVCRRART
jgi:nitrate reductase NapE component